MVHSWFYLIRVYWCCIVTILINHKFHSGGITPEQPKNNLWLKDEKWRLDMLLDGFLFFLINCESQVFLSTNLHSHLKDPTRTAFKHAGFMEVKPCKPGQGKPGGSLRGSGEGGRRVQLRTSWSGGNLAEPSTSAWTLQASGGTSRGHGRVFNGLMVVSWGMNPPKKMISM